MADPAVPSPRAVVSVVFHPPSDASFQWPDPFEVERIDFTRLDVWEVADIAPPPENVDAVVDELRHHGFTIEARTEVGLSFSGTRDDFVEMLRFDPFECGRGRPSPPFLDVKHVGQGVAVNPNPQQQDPFEKLRTHAAALEVGIPGVLAWGSGPPKAPGPDKLTDLPAALGLERLHSEGKGVTVRLVDSGLAKHFWSEVWAKAPDETLRDVRAICDLDPTTDESGHGSAVATNVLTVAPSCVLSMCKCVDESAVHNYALAGFQRAVGSFVDPTVPHEEQKTDRPEVLLCSWVVSGTSVALQLEIANATRNGILVVFAAGNSNMHDQKPQGDGGIAPFVPLLPGVVYPPSDQASSAEYELCPIAHPDAVSVGGVVQDRVGDKYTYTPVAAHFESRAFVYPGCLRRNCPDLVGFTAYEPESPFKLPAGAVTPTARESVMDRKPDGGVWDDRSFRSAGTSMAAGQVAGVAAILLATVRSLKGHPASIKNVLTNSAKTFGGDPPWDPRTGFGLASATDAVEYLKEGFRPFIRTDSGPPPASIDSPDIVLGSGDLIRARRRLGQSFKHLGGSDLDDLDARQVFVRVQNRGKDGGTCTVLFGLIQYGAALRIASEEVAMDPGGFAVVGPFRLPSPPNHSLLVAECVWPDHPGALQDLSLGTEVTAAALRAKNPDIAIRRVWP